MKRKTLFNLVTAGFLTLTASLAITMCRKSRKPVSIETVVKNLKKAGYIAVKEVEFEGGFYQAEVIDAVGNQAEVKLTLRGVITSPAAMTSEKISMVEAIDAVNKAGYINIYSIKLKDDFYFVSAVDAKEPERKAKLKVDVNTGEVSEELYI